MMDQYEIWDITTGLRAFPHVYKTRKRAEERARKMNQSIGAYRYAVDLL